MREKNIEIHETAFVTSAFRATDETLSGDSFAKLWQHPRTENWIKDYLRQVSSEETHTHCLRNRFFLDTMRDLVQRGEIDVVINFGSGFSMYPFLLDEGLEHIEIDKPEIVQFKERQVVTWQEEGVLPKRSIHFIGVDFTKNYTADLFDKIQAIKSDKPCFILIEGVLFFLRRQETDALFSFFDSIQKQDDFIGSASFQDSVKDTLAFDKLLTFFNQKVHKTTEADYLTLQDEYYTNLEHYDLMEKQDYFSLSSKFDHEIILDDDLILNESFYVLKKR